MGKGEKLSTVLRNDYRKYRNKWGTGEQVGDMEDKDRRRGI